MDSGGPQRRGGRGNQRLNNTNKASRGRGRMDAATRSSSTAHQQSLHSYVATTTTTSEASQRTERGSGRSRGGGGRGGGAAGYFSEPVKTGRVTPVSAWTGKVVRIISGGQTGADRAGLEAGRSLGVATGGTAPGDFLTEFGIDDSRAT